MIAFARILSEGGQQAALNNNGKHCKANFFDWHENYYYN